MGFDRRFVGGTASRGHPRAGGVGSRRRPPPTPPRRTGARWRPSCSARAVPASADLHATRAVAYAMTGLYDLPHPLPGRARGPAGAAAAGRAPAAPAGRCTPAATGTGSTTPSPTATPLSPRALLLAGQALDEPRAGGGRHCAPWTSCWSTPSSTGASSPSATTAGSRATAPRRCTASSRSRPGLTALACVDRPRDHAASRGTPRRRSRRPRGSWVATGSGVALYDPATGRCADGLDRHGVSRNAGAESTICALMALRRGVRPYDETGPRLVRRRRCSPRSPGGCRPATTGRGSWSCPGSPRASSRGAVDVTLFATADSLTVAPRSSPVVAAAVRGGRRRSTPKVAECLHIAAAFERAGEFDVLHNHFDFLPLTYSRLVDTPRGHHDPRAARRRGSCRSTGATTTDVAYVAISDADRHPRPDLRRDGPPRHPRRRRAASAPAARTAPGVLRPHPPRQGHGGGDRGGAPAPAAAS